MNNEHIYVRVYRTYTYIMPTPEFTGSCSCCCQILFPSMLNIYTSICLLLTLHETVVSTPRHDKQYLRGVRLDYSSYIYTKKIIAN